MATPFRALLSYAVGWMADRRIPRFLRTPLFRAYAAVTGADLSEIRLALADHPSLTAFFVRRLEDGARPFPDDPLVLPSPVDGRIQAVAPIEQGRTLQAKGRDYALRELLGGAAHGLDLEGGTAWTLYLSPRDYHRIHAPEDLELAHIEWIDGARFSVRPAVLSGRDVLARNERCALRAETARGPLVLVLVGALNVGRIRVVGVERGRCGRPPEARRFRRGDELARFEMGSTVVVLAPRGGPRPLPGLATGDPIRMGQPIGRREA